MCTNTLSYLHHKLLNKLSLKSLLLAFSTVLFLASCGIKGPLYQTPVQTDTQKASMEEQRDESETLQADKAKNKQTNTQLINQEIEPQ